MTDLAHQYGYSREVMKPLAIIPSQAQQLLERWVRLDLQHQEARALLTTKLSANDCSLPLELIAEMCQLHRKAGDALETAVIEYKRECEEAGSAEGHQAR